MFSSTKAICITIKTLQNIIKKLADSNFIHLLFESDPLINLYRSQKNVLIHLMDGIQHFMAIARAVIIQTILQNCFLNSHYK